MHEFRVELSLFDKGGLHLILEEEAAESDGKGWVFRHKQKVKSELYKEKEVLSSHLQKVHEHLKTIREGLLIATSIKIDLEGKEEEFGHIVERILSFFGIYMKFLGDELQKLK